MKKKILSILLFQIVLISFYSCYNNKNEMPSKQIVFFSSRNGGETKTVYDGTELNWTTSDKIGIYSAQARKTSTASAGVTNEVLTAQNNGKTAYFKGNLYWGLNTDHIFYAYYPHSSTAVHPNTAVPVSLPSVQYQGTNPTEHLSALDFMVSDPLTISKPGATGVIASVPLAFNHLFSIIEFKVISSTPKTIKSIKLSTSSVPLSLSSATINITQTKPVSGTSYVFNSPLYQNSAKVNFANGLNLSTDEISTPSAYLMVLPADLSLSNLNVEVTDSENNYYKLTKPGRNFLRGIKYRVALNLDDFVKESLPQGTSNCYIVKPSTSFTFPVNVKGNGNPEVMGDLTSLTHDALSIGLIWQTVDNSIEISNFDVNNQTVTINAMTQGNALIAAFSGPNCTGKILWSWHIWITDYNPNDQVGCITFTPENSLSSITIMNRNLGALSLENIQTTDKNNLFYQWGRKDPFPDNNPYILKVYTQLSIQSSVEIPYGFVCKSGVSDWSNVQNKYLWIGEGGNINSPGKKTIFDPCPNGWRVLHYVNGKNPFEVAPGNLKATLNSLSTTVKYFTMTNPPLGNVQLVGMLSPNNGSINSFGSIVRFSTANHHETIDNNYHTVYQTPLIANYGYAIKTYGNSIRCVKDEY